VLGGDELSRTQGGNNNAYCQDNEISWVHWESPPADHALLRFTHDLLKIFHSNPVLRRRTFFAGRPIADGGVKDVSWVRPDGEEFADEDWRDPENRILGMLVHGQATDEVDERGRPVYGDTLLLLLHAGSRSIPFTLPKVAGEGGWSEVVNTARRNPGARPIRGDRVSLAAHSFQLLRFAEGSAGTPAPS
jgi:isoamylase